MSLLIIIAALIALLAFGWLIKGFAEGDGIQLVTGLCLFACMVVFYHIGVYEMRYQAVKAGVAHYIGDPVTGKSTFTWKTIETKNESSLH